MIRYFKRIKLYTHDLRQVLLLFITNSVVLPGRRAFWNWKLIITSTSADFIPEHLRFRVNGDNSVGTIPILEILSSDVKMLDCSLDTLTVY